MPLFRIHCTTCQARLKVDRPEAVGQILACPKCGSMVHVVPTGNGAEQGASLHHAATPPGPGDSVVLGPPTAPVGAGPIAPPIERSPVSQAHVAQEHVAQEQVAPPPVGAASPREQFLSKVVTRAAIGGLGLFVLGGIVGYVVSHRGPVPRGPVPAEIAASDGPPADVAPQSDAGATTDGNTTDADTTADETPSDVPRRPVLQQEPPLPAPEDPPATPPSPELKPVPGPASPAAGPPTVAGEVSPPGTPVPAPDAEAPRDGVAPEEALTEQPIAAERLADSRLPAGPAAPADRVAAAEPSRRTPFVVREPDDPDAVRGDLESQLAFPLRGVDLPSMPLAGLVDLLTEMTTLPITLDLDTLAAAGVGANDTVSVCAESARVAEVLAEALDDRRLTYVVRDGHVVVTSSDPPHDTLRTVRYRIDDLTDDATDGPRAMCGLIEALVAPTSWRGAGGRGACRAGAGELRVDQTPAVHARVLAFCERLRNARGLATRSRAPRGRFPPGGPVSVAAPLLERPVNCTFHEPARLVDVVRHVSAASEATIVFDWKSLSALKISPHTRITCGLQRQSLADTLDELCGPLDMAWRATDAGALELYAARDADRKLDAVLVPLEKYLAAGGDVGKLDAVLQAATPGDLIREPTDAVAWRDADGPGLIRFEPDSKCLIVRHPPTVQRRITAAIAAAGNGGRPDVPPE